MSQVTIFGTGLSTYVRTARLVCEEKGVAYEHDEVQIGSPELAALHPFGKVPVFRHGDFQLYETVAIARYVDASFPGPKLWPADLKQAALVDQWINVVSAYVYPAVLVEVFQRRVGIRPPDEEAVKAALPRIEKALAVFSTALEAGPFFAGSQLTAADLFVAPIIFYLKMVPEGAMLQGHPSVGRWFEAVASRPSFAATMPKLPPR
jgi:glutathione S-transferase